MRLVCDEDGSAVGVGKAGGGGTVGCGGSRIPFANAATRRSVLLATKIEEHLVRKTELSCPTLRLAPSVSCHLL